MSLEQVAPIRKALMARREAPQASIEDRRKGFEAQMAALDLPEDFTAQRVEIGSGLSGLMCSRDGVDGDRVLMWLHGGAFILGSAESYRPFAARLCAHTGMKVLLPNYRLAPEHTFPAAHEDTLAALEWLEGEGFAAEHLFIGGDSAGANLALGAIQQRIAKDEASPVAAAWLISPYLDLTHSGGSIESRAHRDPFVDPAGMPETAQRYLGETEPGDPRASPLFGSFARFPPTLIQTGSDEVLFSDAMRACDAIRSAGGRCAFQEWAGMIHVWPLFAHQVEEGEWAIAQGGTFLKSLDGRSA